MTYTKYDIYDIGADIADIMISRLNDAGAGGAELHDGADVAEFLETKTAAWDYADEAVFRLKDEPFYVTLYVPADDTALKTAVGDIAAEYGGRVTAADVDDSSWENEWKKYYKPFRIGRIIINPAWEDADLSPLSAEISEIYGGGKAVAISIDPSGSFGTGRHETTEMCLTALQSEIKGGERLLDVGSGSGILTAAGLLLGGSYAAAVDVAKNCVDKTRENLRGNGIDETRYAAVTGNLLEDGELADRLINIGGVAGRGFDIITVNIIADVIIAMAGTLFRLLRTQGTLITSGIIAERNSEVADALADAGFAVADIVDKNGWSMIRCTK